MAELEAQGPNANDQWQRTIPSTEVSLGRSPAESAWVVPWDRQVSKLHASLVWQDGKLRVRRHPRARNQIFYKGEPVDEFTAVSGETFVIGETTFSILEQETATDLPAPVSELTY